MESTRIYSGNPHDNIKKGSRVVVLVIQPLQVCIFVNRNCVTNNTTYELTNYLQLFKRLDKLL